MFDYGSYEGYKLQDEEFDSVDEAIKHAVALNYSATFIIVSIHWTPKLSSPLSPLSKTECK
jgi:hypothetical protein